MKPTSAIAFSSIIIALAFNTPMTHQPTIDTTFYYRAENKFIGTGDVNSIFTNELNNPDKWDIEGSCCFSFGAGNYLAAISFQEDDANPANGGDDGDLTMQEAFDAVKAVYVSTGTFPVNGASFTVGATVITVHRTSVNCSFH
ncbi:hypothetical protein A4H97_20045 [Niastella yeongjuensis]|uniref:Uncharacterized protein n=1 Tax=Niastella yeongjuensis TaxID=354355 RepID=A0A1V9FBY1_9BACT|nr:hypothetical protein [Niastella yeongjuensis]OQP55885.1 hypothetical protein A4H97_20045 [Niastella yeongjuensis]SEP47115.1 hypothetical protein SAMN05660816_06539 [Niastella yeongjuensis]